MNKYTQNELYEMSDKTYPLTFYKNFYSSCSNGKKYFIFCIDCNISSEKVPFADKSRCNKCKNIKNKNYMSWIKYLKKT